VRVLFIGFALPDGDFDEVAASDAGMPIQTQRFGWSVVEALRSADAEVILISAAPATDYPNNAHLVFKGKAFKSRGVDGRTVSFVNLTGLKHVTRFITARVAADSVTRSASPDAVLVHGVHSAFIWVGVRVAKRLGVPVAVILTDPPSLPTPYDGRVSGRLKKVDRRLIIAGLRRVSGVVALTKGLADDLAPGKPWLQFEGIARPLDLSPHPDDVRSPVPSVVYAGAVTAEYGVRHLLDAVRRSSGAWHLHVYGTGPMLAEVQEAARRSTRIFCHGLVDSARLASAYASASLLVNPRSTTASFVKYSFPSKLLEYLSSGRPVMTTRLSTIPDDYTPHLSYMGDSAEEMATAIDAFFEQHSVRPTVSSGREFIVSTKGVEAQGLRLRRFLNSLAVDGSRRKT
jgi:glycosyltransferase involved in cell wall biosynthesis